MGATYQETIVVARNEEQLHRRYERIVSQEEYENGCGGYTGTFAEKHLVAIIAGMHNPTTLETARAKCQKDNETGEPAWAYYIGDNRWYVGGWCKE